MEWAGLIIVLAVFVIFFIAVILLEKETALRYFQIGLLFAMLFIAAVFYYKGHTDGEREVISKIAEKYEASIEVKQGYVIWKYEDFILYFPNKEKLDSFITATGIEDVKK